VRVFSVIFEVKPHKERFDEYLGLGKRLKPILEQVDGFIDNERFESRRHPGLLLSHSTWRDEKSVVRWRTTGEHHLVQEQGRDRILQDYHLRVGEVTADSDPPGGVRLHEQRFDETEIGAAKCVTLTEIVPRDGAEFGSIAGLLTALRLEVPGGGLIDHDLFASIYNPGKLALLVSWQDAATAQRWTPVRPDGIETLRHRHIRIVRDYGMFDRREAPQFYPDAKGVGTIHATHES
jgi:heme-degrading monooxygenase HmoA